MKIGLYILFSAISQIANGQKIINKFGYVSGLCSGTYYFYEDFSFAYERGCEERSGITLGTYSISGDTINLYPKHLDEIDFIVNVEYKKTDSLNYLSTKYSSLNDSIVEAYAIYTSKTLAKKWEANIISTDSLVNDQSIEYDSENFRLIRNKIKTLVVCPIELERLLMKRNYFILNLKVNEIIITLSIPYEILVRMINYEVKYEEMEPGSFIQDGKCINIKYL